MAKKSKATRQRNAVLSIASNLANSGKALTPAGSKSRNTRARRTRARQSRGFLSDLGGIAGNFLLPGIGGAIGSGLGGIAEGIFGKSAPAAQAGLVHLVNQSVLTHSGHEKLSDFTILPDTPAGTLIQGLQLNAQNLGSRFSSFAKLWDRYEIEKLAFQIIPNNPTNNTGGWVAAHEPDPSKDYLSSPDLANRLMALKTAVAAPIWQPGVVQANLVQQPSNGLFVDTETDGTTTGADQRITTLGQFFLAVNTDTVEQAVGSIFVSWQAKFMDPVVPAAGDTLPDTFTMAPFNRIGMTITSTQITMSPIQVQTYVHPRPLEAASLQFAPFIFTTGFGPVERNITITGGVVNSTGGIDFNYSGFTETGSGLVTSANTISFTTSTFTQQKMNPEARWEKHISDHREKVRNLRNQQTDNQLTRLADTLERVLSRVVLRSDTTDAE